MAPLTVEDRLIIKTLPIEKGWAVDRMIAEFTARQRKWRRLRARSVILGSWMKRLLPWRRRAF